MFNISRKMMTSLVICFTVMTVTAAHAEEKRNWEVVPYGSLRLQANYSAVNQAMAGEDDSYIGFQDAYSRLGVRGKYTFNDNLTLSAQLEVSLNIPEFRVEDPTFFDDNAIRVGKVGASGKWGSAWVGKGWLPYYNNIAYPVDMFSSFYSGWATYAFFREYAVAYSTPDIYGFKGSVAYVERTPGGETGYQGTLSYSIKGLTIAVATEQMDDVDDTYGVAVSYTHGPWYGAVKYEKHDNTAGDDIVNLYCSYTMNPFTFKAMVASGVLWGKDYTAAHFGVDYQYNKSLKFFTELYYESNAYAIYKDDAETASDYLGVSGGAWSGPDTETDGISFVVGVRYDF